MLNWVQHQVYKINKTTKLAFIRQSLVVFLMPVDGNDNQRESNKGNKWKVFESFCAEKIENE